MILWHRTGKAAAESIFRNGFQDGRGTYMTGREHSGVWLSDQPLDSNEGACGDVLERISAGLNRDSPEHLDRRMWWH